MKKIIMLAFILLVLFSSLSSPKNFTIDEGDVDGINAPSKDLIVR